MPARSSLLDRVLSRFGLSRKTEKRNFDGADSSRLTTDFLRAWIMSPVQEVKYSLRTLRARARDLERNDSHAKHFLSLLTQNVLGEKGIQLLGRNTKLRGAGLHRDGNSELERGWIDWGRVGNCTLDRQMSWNESAGLILRTIARDGEAFVRLFRYAGNDHAFAIQILDADMFDETYDVRAMPNGNSVRMSVEFDRNGAPVAYWMWNQHPQDTGWSNIPLERVRIPATDILHLFLKMRAGQPRGVTWFAQAIKRLRMLGGYEEAELVAARTAAAKMGFLETDGSDAGPDPNGPNGATGDDEDEDGDRLMDASPGAIEELEPGQKFHAWDPQHPAGNFDPFCKAILRSIAMGLDVAAASLTGDLKDVNYSSIRAGVLTERDMWRMLQVWVSEHLHDQVFRQWVPNSQLAGATELEGPAQRWMTVHWRGRGWPWVDPLKDIQASILEVDNGFNSRTKVLAESGEDFEDVLMDLAEEQDLAKEAGVEFGVVGDLPTKASASEGQIDNKPAQSDPDAVAEDKAGGSGDENDGGRALHPRLFRLLRNKTLRNERFRANSAA